VNASGTSPAYRWVKNGTNTLINGGNISGATTATLLVASVSTADAASYTVVVTNAAGSVTSAPAVLTVINTSTNPPGQLFADDFTRATNPGPLTPWIAQAGTWTISGGTLKGGVNTLRTYADLYVTNSWTNFAVQGQVQFPAGAYGGGIGACVNRQNGAHYAAWVYPENSPGGSRMVKLVKFQTWTSWGYNGASFTPMQQVTVASVGTNWHTVKLACSNRVVSVSYDGNVLINATDSEATPYLSGGASVDMWTDATGYTMSVDNIVVTDLNAPAGLARAMTALLLDVPPVIQGVSVANGEAAVTWQAMSGRTYRLQYLDSLSSQAWKDVVPDILADKPITTATNVIGDAPQRFYRVVLLP
jgi:hypothetical protein